MPSLVRLKRLDQKRWIVLHDWPGGLMGTLAIKGDPKAGIALVQRLFREGKLFIFKTCRNTINELKTYAWRPLLDQPKTENNHTMDAMRYALTMEAREFPVFMPLKYPERKKRVI